MLSFSVMRLFVKFLTTLVDNKIVEARTIKTGVKQLSLSTLLEEMFENTHQLCLHNIILLRF